MRTVIRIENLWKEYRLGVLGYRSLHRELQSGWARFRGRPDPNAPISADAAAINSSRDKIWALKDVSLEVREGEVLGIIGRNGAGKSTLLKILSKVTAPTRGLVKIKGRIASLLEVGTGFHLELTGRENVFLNGAILGMMKAEIKNKFDQIVDFSGVEKFIDTPVKRYSSGMYVRLAFAVAAHLESEILIVDEVLAVGDAEFQKKCVGKMGQVASGGRTILFVSHNMSSVVNLCSSAIVLEKGQVAFTHENPREAIRYYEEHVVGDIRNSVPVPLKNRVDRQGIGDLRMVGFASLTPDGEEISTLTLGQPVEFRIYYEVREGHDPKNVAAAIAISSRNGAFLTYLSNYGCSDGFPTVARRGFISCKVDKLPLSPGSFVANLAIHEGLTIQDWLQEAVEIRVNEGDFFGTGRLFPPSHHGLVYLEQVWSWGEQ